MEPAQQAPRRTELTTPGNRAEMIQKAAATAADVIICDLEDACAASEKAAARNVVVQSLTSINFGRKVRAVRVNGLDTEWFLDDLYMIVAGAGASIDAIVVPKIKSAHDVRFVDSLLLQLERRHQLPKGRIALEVLIETAPAVAEVEAIAAAVPRLASLIFGVADYAADIQASFDPHDMWTHFLYPRQRMINAARAAGISVIDAVSFLFRDHELCRSDAERARSMGFDGKWVVHPGQVDIVNQAFTPPDAEVERARRMIDIWTRAGLHAGHGAVAMGNEMIDLASVQVARRVLARAGVAQGGS